MLILALDTSQNQAVVCLLKDFKLVASLTGSVLATHSSALLPLIDSLLSQNDLKLYQIDSFAVGIGPGSFTGLRIGCATQKTFAQVLSKKVLVFSSLKALYFSQFEKIESNKMAMAKGYQSQIFAGWFCSEKKCWEEDLISIQDKTVEAAALSKFITPIGIERLLSDLNQSKQLVFMDYFDVKTNYLRASQAEIKLARTIAQT